LFFFIAIYFCFVYPHTAVKSVSSLAFVNQKLAGSAGLCILQQQCNSYSNSDNEIEKLPMITKSICSLTVHNHYHDCSSSRNNKKTAYSC